MYGVSKVQLHSFTEASSLNNDLALRLQQIISDAIDQRGHAYLVVSGGKTPLELFKILAKADLPWDKVTITLADERCVPMDDINRNEQLVRNFLLQHHASHAQFLSLYDENQGIEEKNEVINGLPPFDAVVLGMGEDGHTASLFPCAEELIMGLENEAPAILYVNPKTAPHTRVSLSKRRLLNSRTIFIHLIGQKKLDVLHQAIAEDDPRIMPVSTFLNNMDINIQVMYAP